MGILKAQYHRVFHHHCLRQASQSLQESCRDHQHNCSNTSTVVVVVVIRPFILLFVHIINIKRAERPISGVVLKWIGLCWVCDTRDAKCLKPLLGWFCDTSKYDVSSAPEKIFHW